MMVRLLVLILTLGFPVTAFSQTCVESADDYLEVQDHGHNYRADVIVDYIANIDQRDLYNSSGTRLTNFAAILQQDRANLHKSGQLDGFGNLTDTWDTYFATPARRAQLSSATYFGGCWGSAQEFSRLKDGIENGRVGGVLWVVLFRQSNGHPGVYISGVN
ncbi:MAG: hypothetical protein JKY31_09915 [Rhodobacteraceae bacterium]|nr:hypothetical protein [Paracoccaceae bacterium]